MKMLTKLNSIGRILLSYVFYLFVFNNANAQFHLKTDTQLSGIFGYNAISWGDYNNDGLLDILMSGSMDNFPELPLDVTKIFKNNGDETFSEETNFPINNINGQAEWIDFNNDGFLDVQVKGMTIDSNNNLHAIYKIFKNIGNGIFSEKKDMFPIDLTDWNVFMNATGTFLPSVCVLWYDYNNDGFQDVLFIGNSANHGYMCKLYKNNSNETFSEQLGFPLIGKLCSAAACGDYNNDNYSDIILTVLDSTNNWVTKLYKNNGDGTFSQENGFQSSGKNFTSIQWGDLNNDGFLDLLLTGTSIDMDNLPDSNAVSKVFRNNGTGSFSELTSASLAQLTEGTAKLADYNNDGFLDICLAGCENLKSNGYKEYLKIYKNEGNETFTDQTDTLFNGIYSFSSAWGDYNNDGKVDLLLSCYDTLNGINRYVTRIYKNISSDSVNNLPSKPFNLQHNVRFNTVSLTWDKSVDNETSQNGLSYNIRVGTSSGNWDIVNPNTSTSGYRKTPSFGNVGQNTNSYTLNLPPGTYYWSVQATDNTFAGGPWANEDSFTIISNQASNIAMTEISSHSKKISWVNGSGTKRLVFLTEGNRKVQIPIDSMTYSGNSFFGSGTQIDSSGWFCVYNDTSNEVTVSNLKDGMDYKIAVFEYSGVYHEEHYNTSLGSGNVLLIRVKSIFKEINVFSYSNIKFSGESVIWGDYNNDGYLDFLLTGQFQSTTGLYQNASQIYKNNGDNTFTLQSGISIIGLETGHAAWGDYNNDGFLDIVLTGWLDTIPVTKIYKNNCDGSFSEQTEISLTGIAYSFPIWGDYNNDGNLDILISGLEGRDSTGSELYTTKVCKNNGNGTFTEQSQILFPSLMYGQTAWGDYNNDGLLDLLMVGADGKNVPIARLYRNDGNGNFSEQSENLFNNEIIYTCAWGDYNNDGFLDIVSVCQGGPGTIQKVCKIFRNNGNGTFNVQIVLPGKFVNWPYWGDYNNDGFLDILVQGRVFKNNGDETFTEQLGIPLEGISVWGDYDNDGKLDILVSGDYALNIYKNNGFFDANTLPSKPQNLTQVINKIDSKEKTKSMKKSSSPQESVNSATFTWSKSLDAQTPQNGLSYNIRVGTIPGGIDIVSPMSSTFDGFRKIPSAGNTGQTTKYELNNLPNGTYYWSVQAIDNSFAGGLWAQESKLVINDTSVIIKNTRSNSISIYPNPTKNSIQILQTNVEPCIITISNINGKVLLVKQIKEKEEVVNLINISNGLYFVSIQTKDNVNSYKLIIQK